MALLLQVLLHLGEQGYVFFDGEAAYEAEHLVAVFGVAAAFVGMEEIGVYSAGHEVAGAVRGALEEAAELGVGRVENPRL